MIDRRGKPRVAMVPVEDLKRIEEELGQARDALEQRVAERTAALEEANQALRESEKRLTQAQHLAKIGHTIWDEIEGRMAHRSVTVDLIWGISPEETFATFAAYLDTIHPDDRERVNQVMEQAYKDRTGYETVFRIVRPDGETRFIHEIAEPEFDKAGRVVRTVSTVQDITEQKRVEERLRESEERFRELFDESPVAIWEEDWSAIRQMLGDLARDGVTNWRGYFNSHRDQLKVAYSSAEIIEISHAAIDLYRADNREELAEMSNAADVIDEELDAFREIILSFLAGRMTVDIEAKDRAGDGSEIIVRRRVIIPPTCRDDWSRVIYAIEDITERVRVEEQLRQAQKMEAVGQLTGGIAHDFNNLLAIILGNTELMMEGLGDPEKRILAILKAGHRGAELTQRLLSFSRQQSLNPIPVDLNALVVEWKSILELTMGETVRVDLHLGEGLFNVMVDPGQLELSLLNLAINAKHAMPQGGELLIETTDACPDEGLAVASGAAPLGEFVMLTVTDSGIGMSPEILEQAFDPFFTTKDVGEGSGLGLSIVFGFAKQSGGDVMIESEEGSGTTVRFYLPCAEPAEEPAETTQIPDAGHTEGKIILVIEDEGDVRSVVVKILNTLGVQVLEADGAESALALMSETQHIDLVLSDVVLPGGMSGPELARSAQKIWPDLKLLFMSGNAEYTLQQYGLAESAVLLAKPFMMCDLVREVQAALIPSCADSDL